jgi:hypothetical protein
MTDTTHQRREAVAAAKNYLRGHLAKVNRLLPEVLIDAWIDDVHGTYTDIIDPATCQLEELQAENARFKDGTIWLAYADTQRELAEKDKLLAECRTMMIDLADYRESLGADRQSRLDDLLKRALTQPPSDSAAGKVCDD